ncbi:MAG: TonB family protein [Acidobacteria bacterium]|nr:TonB family protein [Acidobacteriota bacterium]
MPPTPLNGNSKIPDYIQLEVLGSPTLVPRNMPVIPLESKSEIPTHIPLDVLKSRIVIPSDARPAVMEATKSSRGGLLPEVLDPDIFNTGEVHLMVRPVEINAHAWRGQAGLSTSLFHALLILLVLFQPKLFPYQAPSEADIEAAHKFLGKVYLPPSARTTPHANAPVESTAPKIRIDPRALRQLLPPTEEPSAAPKSAESPKIARELPVAPTPQVSNPSLPQPSNRFENPTPRLEQPRTTLSTPQLRLPGGSAGRSIEDSIRDAARNRGTGGGDFPGAGAGGPGQGGGPGGQGMGGAFEVLTPTEGVDFSGYFQRMLARVKYNWYAVIPESARMGEKGRVILEFSIMKNGSVPQAEPVLVSTSGREPLDRAAVSSIHTSNPFEPLPPAFSGPLIRLRFTFLYNIPLEAGR